MSGACDIRSDKFEPSTRAPTDCKGVKTPLSMVPMLPGAKRCIIGKLVFQPNALRISSLNERARAGATAFEREGLNDAGAGSLGSGGAKLGLALSTSLRTAAST